VRVDDEVAHLTDVLCRRVKCGDCHTSWTLRPPGLLAHKHFQMCVVARATSRYVFEAGLSLQAVAKRYACSRRTVGRWLSWLVAIAHADVLLGLILRATGVPVLVRAEPAKPSRTAKLVAEMLELFESLASGWSHEPPGLRSVLERVLADRAGVGTYRCPLIPELARRPEPAARGMIPM
jgi:hypothetical protein